MATKPKNCSLDEGHETEKGLHGAAVISKRRMGQFEALRGLGVHDMPPKKIKLVREGARLCQAFFAAVLNTSVSNVLEWTAGAKKPSGPSLKLLNLIKRKDLEAVRQVGSPGCTEGLAKFA